MVVKFIVSILSFLIINGGCTLAKEKQKRAYDESWESLAKHNEQPEWFQDAKLGIYFHWGVYSVPAYSTEWYPRWMHYKGTREYNHHIEKYGHPSKFGYHDFVPMFTAEKFNAAKWADLFQMAGAKFAGPVAEHHDGFSMWASDITPWNSKDKGPHKDITGELAKELRKRDMKLITTFHHSRNLQRYKGKEKEEIEKNKQNIYGAFNNSHYPLFDGMPPASDDADLNYLYGNIPEEKWLEELWFGKLKEVIDKYQPDIIWFDSWLDQIPEDYRKKFCAYYLNHAAKNEKQVVIVRKQNDLPLSVSVDDLEKSRKNELGEKVWMTDETISTGSWCYTENLKIKPAKDVLHVLIDIVSKNGVLLLNISPKADGSIPVEQGNVLLKMGEWLKKYGEAIYGTRPWYTYGEGPTKEPEGHFDNYREFLKVKYSSRDIRFTTKDKNTIYAIFLGWPGNNKKVVLKSFAKDNWTDYREIKSVELFGSREKLNYSITNKGLEIIFPDKAPDDMAVVCKIKL